ncbi:MAG: hypothetical protein P9M02_04875 [Candidatus Susulua stagnicola]|nr:hypothetical protein [Candidatus Susulua stagnicola]
MKDNIIDMVVALRNGFNDWWSTFSNSLIGHLNFESIVIAIYAMYVLASLGDIIDKTKEGKEEGNHLKGLFAVLKTVGYLLVIYCFGLGVVFVFPASDFVLSLKKMLNQYYAYPLLGIGILLICGFIAYICGIIFAYIHIMAKKIFRKR